MDLNPTPALYQAKCSTSLPTRSKDSIKVPPEFFTRLESWLDRENSNGRNLILWGKPTKDWLAKSMQKVAQSLQGKGEVVIYLEMKPADCPTDLMHNLRDCLARCVECTVIELPRRGDSQEDFQDFLRKLECRLHPEVLITIIVANVPMASFSEDNPASTALLLLLSSPRFRTWWTTLQEPRRDFFKDVFCDRICIQNRSPTRLLR